MSGLTLTTLAVPQAAAEYGVVVAQSAADKMQVLVNQTSTWVGENPLLVGAGVALVLILFWGTRSRTV